MGLFSCSHPFNRLGVYSQETSKKSVKFPKDYVDVYYNLFCQKCGEKLTLKYAKCIRTNEEVIAEMVQDLKDGKKI